MKTFDIGPCYEVGLIKGKIKEAILEGEISNSYEEAKELMRILGKEMGLKEKDPDN